MESLKRRMFRKEKETKKRSRYTLMAGILLAALIVYSLCLLLPLCYGLMFSLKTNDDYTNHPIGFPNPLYFQNYINQEVI